MKITRIKDLYYRFDARLNDPVWLTKKYRDEHMTEKDIAELIGCSEKLAHKRLHSLAVLNADQILDVHTGFFHFAKEFIMLLAKPYIKRIKQAVDTTYDRTKSRNAGIFKKIISDMERLDADDGFSSSKPLGMTRKAFYILAGKFLVCLYEYDIYYSERMDYVLKKVLEQKDSFYLDLQANPENWYPHRDYKTQVINMLARNTEVGEKSYYVKASEFFDLKKKQKED